MSVTRDVFQLPMGWLNAWASSNIEPMFATRDVFQLPMGWLNAWASSNIEPMSVTRDVSQPPMGWLNAWALWNIKPMFVIRLVHVRSTSRHFFCWMRDRNSCSLLTTYRTPSITPVSPIRARGVATMVNPPGPARRFGTLTTLTSCRCPAALGVVVRFFVGVDDEALEDFLFLSMNCP